MNAYDPHNILASRGFSYEGRSGYISRWRNESLKIEVWVSWLNYDAWILDSPVPDRKRSTIANLEGRLVTPEDREEVNEILKSF